MIKTTNHSITVDMATVTMEAIKTAVVITTMALPTNLSQVRHPTLQSRVMSHGGTVVQAKITVGGAEVSTTISVSSTTEGSIPTARRTTPQDLRSGQLDVAKATATVAVAAEVAAEVIRLGRLLTVVTTFRLACDAPTAHTLPRQIEDPLERISNPVITLRIVDDMDTTMDMIGDRAMSHNMVSEDGRSRAPLQLTLATPPSGRRTSPASLLPLCSRLR